MPRCGVVVESVEGVVRKELEALTDLRALMVRRSTAIDTLGVFDLLAEIEIAMAAAARLLTAGVLVPNDWNFATGQSAEDVRVVRVRLRSLIYERLKSSVPAFSVADLARADGFLDDLTAFVVEVAAYDQAYRALSEGVIDCKARFLKVRAFPPADRVERLQRAAYRQEDPEQVRDRALIVLADARARISWARGRLKRGSKPTMKGSGKKSGGGKDRSRVDAQAGIVTAAGVIASFHAPSIEKRLARLRRGPDLLRDAGIEDGPETSAPE